MIDLQTQGGGAYRLCFIATGCWRGPIKRMASETVAAMMPGHRIPGGEDRPFCYAPPSEQQRAAEEALPLQPDGGLR
jgi:hypothetical protein